MKRPLAFFAVVFVSVLFLLQFGKDFTHGRIPVQKLPNGEEELAGYIQDDVILVCGVVKDYAYKNKYGKITTELFLKDIQIIPPYEDNSEDNTNSLYHSINNSQVLIRISDSKKITQRGQSVLVYMEDKQNIVIGSRIILSGKLSFWRKATNPGEFDAKDYYENRDILFAIKKARILQIEVRENRLWQEKFLYSRLLYRLKEFRLEQEARLVEHLPSGNSAIMRAMLFGNRSEMEEEIKDLYQNNGIAHILAISGLHISLLGMAVYRVLCYIPLKNSVILLLSEVFLLLYGCMVGFSPSTFRAIFMFTLFLLSKLFKRSYDMITAMAASAIIQLSIHPGYIFDCAFQLSYGAIIGIGVLYPMLEQIKNSLENKWVKRILAGILPSLSVTLVTAPILVYHYHELSFFSIILNIMVLPLMAPLLLSGMGLLCVTNISWLAGICTFLINTILWLFENGCRFLELFPIGRRNIAPFSLGVMIIYYMLLLSVTILVKKKSQSYQLAIILLCVVLLLFPKKRDFAVWMLDVGQGDCNVIFTEEGNCYVIDCGSSSKSKVGEKILIPFLKYHGIRYVDGVIVTHPDVDHMNGILELLELGEEENINIERIFVYKQGLLNDPEEWEELNVLAKEQKIPIYGIARGDILKTNSTTIECLYPLSQQQDLKGNEASLVLSVGSETFRGLFTGDMEKEGEKRLLAEYFETDIAERGNYHLLKVGHHGSSGSSSSEFLQWVNPKWAVISCGENNRYGHPHKETIERLQKEKIEYFITYEEGALCFSD